MQISPKATVPVLQLPGGRVLDQSVDIMRWALNQHDPSGWLPQSPAELARQSAWISACDTDFKYQLDRYKYPSRYALPDGLQHRALGSAFLSSLDAALVPNGYLAATDWGFADAALAPFVRQWAHTESDWFASQPWPSLQRWLSAFEDSAAFLAVMARFSAWVPGGAPLCWPVREFGFAT